MPPSALSSNPMECPMSQSNDLSRSLAAFDQDSTLIAVIETSQSNWLVAGLVPGIERQPLKKLSPGHRQLGAGLGGAGRDGSVAGMTPAAKSPYTGYRFPPEIISHAIWL